MWAFLCYSFPMRNPYAISLCAALSVLGLSAVMSADKEPERDLSWSDEGLQEVREPDGTVTVDLEGRYQSISVVRIGEDGRLEEACVASEEERDAFFAEADNSGNFDGAEK